MVNRHTRARLQNFFLLLLRLSTSLASSLGQVLLRVYSLPFLGSLFFCFSQSPQFFKRLTSRPPFPACRFASVPSENLGRSSSNPRHGDGLSDVSLSGLLRLRRRRASLFCSFSSSLPERNVFFAFLPAFSQRPFPSFDHSFFTFPY